MSWWRFGTRVRWTSLLLVGACVVVVLVCVAAAARGRTLALAPAAAGAALALREVRRVRRLDRPR